MAGTEYPKIPGPFRRDPKTNLLTDEWSSKELELLGPLQIWNFTEKVDGTNVRIIWDGYRISWQGRTDRATFSADQTAALEKIFGTPERETLFEQSFGDKPAIIYGELYGPGIQSGGVYRNDITFVGFDAYIGGMWLMTFTTAALLEDLGLESAPILLSGASIYEAIELVSKGLPSLVAEAGKSATSEGLVGTLSLGMLNRRGERISVKVKHVDFHKE